MGLNFTHHDVNWIYNLHHLKGQRYYLKTRYPEVRLISCLRDSNKGMNKDFLIILGEWHDGLPCLTREGRSGGALGLDLFLQSYHIFTLTHFVPIFFFLCWYLKFLLICAIPFLWLCFLIVLQIITLLFLTSILSTSKVYTKYFKPRCLYTRTVNSERPTWSLNTPCFH